MEAEALVETMAYRLASVHLARNLLRGCLTRFTTLAYLLVEVDKWLDSDLSESQLMLATLPNMHAGEKAYLLRNLQAELQTQALLKKLV